MGSWVVWKLLRLYLILKCVEGGIDFSHFWLLVLFLAVLVVNIWVSSNNLGKKWGEQHYGHMTTIGSPPITHKIIHIPPIVNLLTVFFNKETKSVYWSTAKLTEEKKISTVNEVFLGGCKILSMLMDHDKHLWRCICHTVQYL